MSERDESREPHSTEFAQPGLDEGINAIGDDLALREGEHPQNDYGSSSLRPWKRSLRSCGTLSVWRARKELRRVP